MRDGMRSSRFVVHFSGVDLKQEAAVRILSQCQLMIFFLSVTIQSKEDAAEWRDIIVMMN